VNLGQKLGTETCELETETETWHGSRKPKLKMYLSILDMEHKSQVQ
jgi:hypothetical protein